MSDNLKSWSKGQSRNSKGYKKGTPNRRTVIKQWLKVSEFTENVVTGEYEHLTQEDLITLALIKKARYGNVQAYKALMDSAYGKPTIQIEQEFKEIPLFPIEVLDGQGNIIEEYNNDLIER